MQKVDVTTENLISPSEFMRELRPEYYSDTENREVYILESPVFEYHLETITNRNETHKFEVFCRQLCQRTICPNLRAHTGPDGGGDSKVDTETHPVANEVSILFFIGEPLAGQERWAFAISAKKDWKAKVRDDVAKIAETGRGYKRIFFITSQFARDKDRADVEDNLSNKYGISVTIHDRSWIVKEIIENNRKDLAFNFLGVGEVKDDPLRLGPTDYSRTQQLTDIEQSFGNADAYKGIERQRVTEALIAAKLSRNLELPRTETEGRFLRAIRLADADGSYQQQLEARYEQIWTAFWYFDDIPFLLEHYESFESRVIDSSHSCELDFLCNLHQLLVNAVIHKYVTAAECDLEQRRDCLIKAFQKITANTERPNNSLEAKTSLLLLKINQTKLDQDKEDLAITLKGFSEVLDLAKGLGEFNVQRLVQLVDVIGAWAGSSPEYYALFEKATDFVSSREGEAKVALMLLKRAKQLDFDDRFEMIRLLGKSAAGLNKDEYREEQIDALWLLMLAYRSAGMLWAARATCITLTAAISIVAEKESDLPASIIPALKLWAWIAIELQHIPDLVSSCHLMAILSEALPLTEDSQSKVNDDLMKLQAAFGCLFLNLDEESLGKLGNLPDILDSLDLFLPRSALLYTMGYIDILQEDGSIPASAFEKMSDIENFYSGLANQPLAQSLHNSIILNDDNPQTLNTNILGMSIEIDTKGSASSTLVAEMVLAYWEAFFATAIEHRLIPHTEKLSIALLERHDVVEPSLDITSGSSKATLSWPASLSPTNPQSQANIQNALIQITGEVLVKFFVMDDAKVMLDKLFSVDGVSYRVGLVTSACISHHRVMSRYLSKLSDWEENVKTTYTLKDERPVLERPRGENNRSSTKNTDDQNLSNMYDHRDMSVRSVIDMPLWDRAKWEGMAYVSAPDRPPYLAFMFKAEEAARQIFQGWHDRFGREDKDEEIYLSIVRQIPNQSPHHYHLILTSNLLGVKQSEGKTIVVASRSKLMEPMNSDNLKRFLQDYNRFGAFFLIPVVLSNGQPRHLFDLAILKRNLTVKSFKDIVEGDIEFATLKFGC